MTVPAFNDAKRDQALRGSPMMVYLDLLDMLHPIEWRPVKQLALADRVGLSLATVERAIAVLVAQGYLERGPVTPGSPRSYRLVYSRMPAPQNEPQNASQNASQNEPKTID